MTFDLRTAIGTIAPTLATMIGGPLVGTAVAALANCFGLPATATLGDVTTAVQTQGMTPEIVAAMRAADQAHAEKLKQMDIDVIKINADYDTAMAKIDAGDRADARGMQVANKSFMPALLSGIVTMGYLLILTGMMLGWLKVDDSQALLLMLGSLGTGWAGVIAYWFGSSRSSEDKTRLLAQAPPVK